MFSWLLAVAVAILVWARLWRTNPSMAFGILIGLPIAWIFSRLITPYVTGMKDIPVWLPPIPVALVALTLFVTGTIVWFRGPKASDEHKDDSGDESGH